MTDFQKICLAFILAVGVVLVAAVASKISHKNGYKQGYSDALASIKPDTVWRDTPIYEEKPVPEYHYRDTGRIVYIPVPVLDTTGHHDTTLVPMHPEVKYHSDNENYELQISGILPNLDWIKVHQKTAYITNTITEYKPYKWTLSAFAEGGATLNRFDVRAGLEYERQIAGPLRGAISAGYEYSNIGRGVFVEGGVKLQILKK